MAVGSITRLLSIAEDEVMRSLGPKTQLFLQLPTLVSAGTVAVTEVRRGEGGVVAEYSS